MQSSINRVVLLGALGRDGVEMRSSERGVGYASFLLILNEEGQDGKVHQTWVPCECWGRGAEPASEIAPGAVVAFEGRLRRQKRGDGSWDTIVAGYQLTPLRLAPGAQP